MYLMKMLVQVVIGNSTSRGHLSVGLKRQVTQSFHKIIVISYRRRLKQKKCVPLIKMQAINPN